MAEEEVKEDFSLLPLPEQFTHKNWKARKGGYEAAARAFAATPDEGDPAFRPFLQDTALWKGAVLDSNVAAQLEGVNALCAFLKYGGMQACTRSRSLTITPLIEKGLSSVKVATKQCALEAILLYVEIDKADPILDDLLQGLSHKQPKLVAATLTAFTALYHAYGIKIVEPKPVLKTLPKLFGHADKNVRAEASNLVVELYRWLREAMKPMFWEDLKPVQQQDLEKLLEKVKSEPAPKQERLQRSQQAAQEQALLSGTGAAEEDEAPVEEVQAYDLAEPQDILSKLPSTFYDHMSSAKWKERKEALEALYEAANTPRIAERQYEDLMAILAKSMKDANIVVVTNAANCIDVFAKGLQRGFGKYRSRVMPAVLERLKEKKQGVKDALGQALDSIVATTSLTDCLEDIFEFLKHKNPEVKAETLKLLIRSLKTTKIAPSKADTKAIAEAAIKLLTESHEATRSGGAEALGTLMKIMGERAMGPFMDGLDDMRKVKIKEFCDAAVVRAKDKPKPVAAPAPRVTATQKRPAPSGAVKRTTSTPAVSKPATAKRAPSPQASAPAASKGVLASGKAGPTKLGGLPRPGGALALKSRLPGAGVGSASKLQSPRRGVISPDPVEESSSVQTAPKLGLGLGRGLTGRTLGKPISNTFSTLNNAPASPAGNRAVSNNSASAVELAELEDIKTDRDRFARLVEELRTEKTRLTSQIHELQNQNAQLIEDHTRDVLSIKAKETQLVRARSDAEAAETSVNRLQREADRLKRELSRTVRQAVERQVSPSEAVEDSGSSTAAIYRDRGQSGVMSGTGPVSGQEYDQQAQNQNQSQHSSNLPRTFSSASEEKENGFGYGTAKGSMGRDLDLDAAGTHTGQQQPVVENWKRAAEVTSQLKARIELMKAKQGLSRQQASR